METEDRPVEIKDLNKTQLIMLAILLSFITSIATGIVTVTLMQQAPTGVTQTINRVVQQTIEKVVPDYTPGSTQTVIVKEDDLVVDAVSKARASIGTFAVSANQSDNAYSIGNGIFLVPDATFDATKTYSIEVPNRRDTSASAKDAKTKFDAKVIGVSPLGFSIVSIADPDVKLLPKLVLAKDSESKIGQTMVLVGKNTVDKGLFKSVSSTKDDPTTSIFTLNPEPADAVNGALVLNLDGDVVGLVVPKNENGLQVIGADVIAKLIAKPSLTSTAVPPAVPPVTPPTPPATPAPAN